MRNLRSIALILAGAFVSGALVSTPVSAGVSFDFFYSNLSPHGRWVVSGSYGRVWQPDEYRPGWNPYYDGHWGYTDLGNTWVSDYSWGAIPYHYGTWAWDPAVGWVWVPGTVWAPAWVVFRTGPDYIGWAPVTPQFSVGVTIGLGDYDRSHFVFVPSRSFFEPRIRTVVVPRSRTTVILNRTKIVNNCIHVENNVVVNRGLNVGEIERVTGRKVRPVPVERVRGLGRSVKREEIQVDAARVKHGLKAAEPVRGERARWKPSEGREGRSAENRGEREKREGGNVSRAGRDSSEWQGNTRDREAGGRERESSASDRRIARQNGEHAGRDREEAERERAAWVFSGQGAKPSEDRSARERDDFDRLDGRREPGGKTRSGEPQQADRSSQQSRRGGEKDVHSKPREREKERGKDQDDKRGGQ